MGRISVAILLDAHPNFDHIAFKYYLLSANKMQNTFEFTFPDGNFYFPKDIQNYHELNNRIQKISKEYSGYSTRKPNYSIFITQSPLFNNWFFSCSDTC